MSLTFSHQLRDSLHMSFASQYQITLYVNKIALDECLYAK